MPGVTVGINRDCRQESLMIRTIHHKTISRTFLRLFSIPHHTLFSGFGSTHERSIPKRQEAEKIEFENMPQESRCGSWKISHPREVTSGSTHPTLAVQWLAEIAQAASMDDSNHTGFALLPRSLEFATPDSKIVSNCEDYPSRIQTKTICGTKSVQRETLHANRRSDHAPDLLIL